MFEPDTGIALIALVRDFDTFVSFSCYPALMGPARQYCDVTG